MLYAILRKVEAAYDSCPAYNGENSMEKPCFERQANFIIKILVQLIYLRQ